MTQPARRLPPSSKWLLLGLIAVVLVGVVVSTINPERTEATPDLPADQQAYWNWVRSLNQQPDEALSSGLTLLQAYPDLSALYLRLTEQCVADAAQARCTTAFATATPTTERSHLYREAAQALLDASASQAAWQRLATHEALDATLARRIADHANHRGEANWLPALQTQWEAAYAADSSQAGILFGLGYLANLRHDWQAAEQYLQRAANLATDPQVYRELGRIYFNTGNGDAFVVALEQGIQAAILTHDLEQALILRGNLGLELVKQGELTEAQRLFEEALAESRNLADEETAGYNLYRLAELLTRQQGYDRALDLLSEAAQYYATHAPRRAPEVAVLRGEALMGLYRFSDAEETLQDAVDEAQTARNILAEIRGNTALGQVRYRMGRFAAAREAALDAWTLANRYRQHDQSVAARLVLGDIERHSGNFEQALEHFEEALATAEDMGNTLRIREVHNRLGLTALIMRNTNRAWDHFQYLVDEEEARTDPSKMATAYLGLARTYQQFGNRTEAHRMFDAAIPLAQQALDQELLGNIYVSKSLAYVADEEYEEALALLSVLEKQPLTAYQRYRLPQIKAEIHLEQGRYQEARDFFEQATQLEALANRPTLQWQVHYGSALAAWGLQDQADAEAQFAEALRLIETIRSNLRTPQNRSYYALNKAQVYKDYASFLDEQGRHAEALHAIERARSRSLVDLLYTTQQAGTDNVATATDAVIEMARRRQALQQELAAATADLAQEDAPLIAGLTREAQLLREYERADSMYQTATLGLSVSERIYTFNPLTADSVQATLHEDEAMVIYNLRAQHDYTTTQGTSVAYIVLPDTVLVQALEVEPERMANTVRFFRALIEKKNSNIWQPTARRLYQELLQPIVSQLPETTKHLHLVPEGSLHYLPFAALQDDLGTFLVEQYTLSVVPSASILKLNRANNPNRWRAVLLMGDPNGDLPGARREVTRIAERSPNRRLAVVGERVNQETLEELARSYDIIHLATHGRFVSRAPWRSHLEMHGDVLSVDEIGRLDLDAYLVTLSACETALGGGLTSDIPDGDEWIGLNQAFLAAGTPSVLASLWAIDDQASSDFMIGFYEALGPRGKSQALAQIQQRFLRQPTTQHPYYWAAFTLVGDPI